MMRILDTLMHYMYFIVALPLASFCLFGKFRTYPKSVPLSVASKTFLGSAPVASAN
jgi:hypothetical protein